MSEKSGNSKVFKQIASNPDSYIVKRDISKCFKDKSGVQHNGAVKSNNSSEDM